MMKINFIAFDSFGVKSSCTQVKTPDVTITIDPGIADEVDSFPLPRRERYGLVGKYDERIRKACAQSDAVAITHYHYDHHICDRDKRLYGNKVLLLKHPTQKINRSQKARAKEFLEKIKGLPKRIEFADGKEFCFGKTKIKFSKPLWHGPKGTSLGFVIMVSVQHGKEKLLYTSDLNGPYLPQYADLIIKERPTYLILDGPVLYLLGFILSYGNLLKIIKNLIKIVKNTKPKYLILDHHPLRDYRYNELLAPVYEQAKLRGLKILTAAEFLGKEPKVLVGYRKNGPTRWKKWQKFSIKDLERMVKKIKSKGFEK